MDCPKGQIRRKSYVLKSGKRVKSKCIDDKGNLGKGKKLFDLDKNGLGKFGYDDVVNLSIRQRHIALKKALKVLKPLSVFRRLIAIATLNKNTNPKISKIFRDDAEWIKTTKEYKNRD